MRKLDHVVQIAGNVILNHSIVINKQYLGEKQLCTHSLVHFFADTAPLRREIAPSRVFWRTQKNDDEVFFLLFILNAVSNALTPGNSLRPNKVNGLGKSLWIRFETTSKLSIGYIFSAVCKLRNYKYVFT